MSQPCDPSLHACSDGDIDGDPVGATEMGVVLGDVDGDTLGLVLGAVVEARGHERFGCIVTSMALVTLSFLATLPLRRK